VSPTPQASILNKKNFIQFNFSLFYCFNIFSFFHHNAHKHLNILHIIPLFIDNGFKSNGFAELKSTKSVAKRASPLISISS